MTSCQNVSAETKQTQEVVMTELGQATEETEFEMTETLHEFRIELLNILPQSDPKNRGVLIKEMTWTGLDVGNKTIWSQKIDGEWKAIHEMTWQPYTEF